MFASVMVQVRRVDIDAFRFPDILGEKMGQSMRHFSNLNTISLCVGKDSARKQCLQFQDTRLKMDSVSVEFVTLLLQLNTSLLEKVNYLLNICIWDVTLVFIANHVYLCHKHETTIWYNM